jgi:uncharacterized protein YfeS
MYRERMRDPTALDDLSPKTSHPRAAQALKDAFFWDTADEGSPFGNDSGGETLAAFYDWRDENPDTSPIVFLDDLLSQWEVKNDHWDVVQEGEVHALGADDEYSLLTRDEAILALAFGQLVVEGKIDEEVRRRALIALKRQTLPALLHGWGERMAERAARIERMKGVLERRWD